MNQSRKRKPEVVIFEERARKQRKETSKEKIPNINSSTDTINFKEIAREVRELGVSGFKKKDRRKYRQQEVQALGAKAPKKQKMPYPLLMELKKIRDEKDKNQRELDTSMGIFKKKKSNDKDKHIVKGSGRWVDRSKGLDSGTYKKGIRKLKKKDIAKFKNEKS